MKFLLIPSVPVAVICCGIDTAKASLPDPVIATINTLPIALAVIFTLLLILGRARQPR